MAKHCDGCGKEIPTKAREVATDKIAAGSGDELERKVRIEVGATFVNWDLCEGCLAITANVLEKALPASPRAEWNHVLFGNAEVAREREAPEL